LRELSWMGIVKELKIEKQFLRTKPKKNNFVKIMHPHFPFLMHR